MAGKERGREREREWENKIESSMFTFYFPLLHSINDGNKIELFSFRMALYKLHLQREKKNDFVVIELRITLLYDTGKIVLSKNDFFSFNS